MGKQKLLKKIFSKKLIVLNLIKKWALFMGFEHERIHFETSTVLIRQYPIHMVTRPVGWPYGPAKLSKLIIFNISN